MDKTKKHSFEENSDKNPIMDIEQFIQHLLSIFSKDIDEDGESFIYGCTIFQKSGDMPDIQGFKVSNVSNLEDEDEIDDIYIHKINPFIEIYEIDKHIYVTCDLQIEENEAEITANEKSLEITVISSSFAYSKEIELPYSVDADSAKYNYINGIFEIILKKSDSEM